MIYLKTDLDIIGGVVQNEGSTLATMVLPDIEKINMTEKTFMSGVNASKAFFHGLNETKISEFYLKNVNTSDPNAVKHAFYAFFGDLVITCPTYHFAKQYATHSPLNVYFYELTYETKQMVQLGCGTDMSICHGADIEFVFGLPFLDPKSYTQVDKDFSEQVMQMWTNFAKNGYSLLFYKGYN